MTTLPIRAGAMPLVWPMAALARAGAAISTMLEVCDEARQQAKDAQKRYPFVMFE